MDRDDSPDTALARVRHYLIGCLILAALAVLCVVLACIANDIERSNTP